jgi:hypothetical protein
MLPSKWYLEKPVSRQHYHLGHGYDQCICPYAESSPDCGSWCPLFEIISTKYSIQSDIDAINETVDCGTRVVLHCGSGNAEYKIQEIKGE